MRTFTLICFIAGVCLPASAADKPDRKGLDFFEKKIRPVLVKHCYQCHSAKAKNIRGKLLLDTRAGIRKGGESGPAVVPGKPADGTILGALKHEDFEMPPNGKLPKAVINDFVAWIKIGAPDPRTAKTQADLIKSTSIDLKKGREFWSFQPLRQPKPPKVAGENGKLSPIDRFIRAKLQAKGLKPAPPASKRVLIRRLCFDLIGLPPTPEQIDRFLKDESPNAVEKLVDRLLANKHFGERWARHWLDVARFAESSGGGRTAVYHLAWRYRDYVVDAYNKDKPFNEFVREQIAGDLLPWKTIQQRREHLTATGFLMLGPTNYELQDKELLRMEVVDEQLDTLGRAFLGMTIGCARCHDHKFDPIPNRDYYALAGIFRSTHLLTPGNVSGYLKRPLPVNEQHARQLAAFEKKTNPLKDEIASLKEQLRRLRRNLSGIAGGKVAAKKLPGIVVDDTQAKFTGEWNESSSIKPFVGRVYRYASAAGRKAVYNVKIPKTGEYEVRLSYSAHGNRAAMAHVTIKHADGVSNKRIDQRKRPPIDGLFMSLGKYRFEKGMPAVVTLSTRAAHGTVIADAVQLLSKDDRAEPQAAKKSPKEKEKRDKLRATIASKAKRLKAAEAELKQLQKDAPPPAPLTMAVEDHKETGDYFICIRGNVHKLGDKVPRGFLRVIADDSPPKIPAGSSGRRQLADWLVSDENPLTARVYVNRVWHHLFGTGLVRTVDNFGKMGERPSHPELLDWLAAEFRRQRSEVRDQRSGFGWSTKALIRAIVLSKAYQQSSNPQSAIPNPQSVDPENRLLSHQNRRRLDAECIRDSLLAVSGQLDKTLGGPMIDKRVRSEFGYKHRSNRRSIYVPAFRNTIHPLLAVFDIADPNLVSGRRNVSTLPTQALYLMNSPFVMEQSRHAAERLLKTHPKAHESHLVGRAYEWTLGRKPTKQERELALAYLQQTDAKDRQQVWATLIQTLFGSIDFRYIE